VQPAKITQAPKAATAAGAERDLEVHERAFGGPELVAEKARR
jgi:hypothetical protein